MELPKEVREPVSINPNIMIIYSNPKVGKTTICSHLEDHLILELEPNGADFIRGRVMEINLASEFDKALKLIKESSEKVCKYLVIDTCTKMDDWSEIKGTYNYMKKSQGKKFNREGEIPDGKIIYHTDDRFETVHVLGQGHGYAHSRDVMISWYDDLADLINLGKVDHIILLTHVKDKLIESKTGEMVEVSTLNLTGKVKSIYCTRVDAVGNFYRKGKKGYLNFNNEHKVISGGRCNHLDKEILISEKLDDNTIATYWNDIYITKTK